MKKLMTTTAVLMALAVPAAAQFTREGKHEPDSIQLACTGVRQLFSNKREKFADKFDNDPVAYIDVTVDDADDPTSMDVVHVTRSGVRVSRSDQYDMGAKLRKTQRAYVWSGAYNRNPSQQMSGVLERKGGTWTYSETRFNQGERTWANIAYCS